MTKERLENLIATAQDDANSLNEILTELAEANQKMRRKISRDLETSLSNSLAWLREIEVD